jgi:hypothetical protein
VFAAKPSTEASESQEPLQPRQLEKEVKPPAINSTLSFDPLMRGETAKRCNTT